MVIVLGPVQLHPHEEATIRAFVNSAKRDRFLMLLANPKRRRRILNELNHFAGWDQRFATELPSNADLEATLRAERAPESCHLISNDPELDGRDLPLSEAVARADAYDFASILCCIPGRLALFLDETPRDVSRPLLLQREDTRLGKP